MRLPATNQKASRILNRIACPSIAFLIEKLLPMISDDPEEVNDMTILVTKDLVINWAFAEKARNGPTV